MKERFCRFRVGAKFLEVESGDRGIKNEKYCRCVTWYGRGVLCYHQPHIYDSIQL